jgi:membrane-associated protein
MPTVLMALTVVLAIDILDPATLLETGSYVILFGIVFAETGLLAGFFLPGDSLLFTAGVFAAVPPTEDAQLNIVIVVVGCFIAAVAGDQTGFYIGHKMGPSLFRKPDARLFKQEHVHRAREYFDEHGPKTVILARFVPIVRTFTPVLAGVGKMEYRTFITYNVVGGLIWAVGIPLLGYTVGDAIGADNIDKYLLPIIGVVILASVAPALLEYRKHRTASKAAAAEAQALLDEEWHVPEH